MNDNDQSPDFEVTNQRHKLGPRRYKIDRTALASWTKPLDEESRGLLFWLHDYASTRDLPFEELAKRLKQPNGQPYSKDSVYQTMTGRRGKDQLSNILAAIADLKKIEVARSQITRVGFVETDITRRVFQICDATRNFGKMGVLIGNTHIGKTTALVEYADRNNHGSTPYVRMPAGGARSNFLRRLAGVLNLGVGGNDYTIGTKIMGSLDERQLLIVDEFHQCIPRPTIPHSRGVNPACYNTVEWLRELHDQTGVAILLAATPTFDQVLDKNDAFKGIFKQTLQRALITCRLPDAPTRKSLDSFAKHFGLKPATDEALDLQKSIIGTDSLGRWISILEGASKIASKESQPLTWDHVLKSHTTLLRLERGD